jgi:hypothetical protein
VKPALVILATIAVIVALSILIAWSEAMIGAWTMVWTSALLIALAAYTYNKYMR